MTNEEVLKLIEDGRIIPIQIKANDEETSKYNLENLEALNMIIKALKEQDILDKVRAEIEQNAYPIVHGVNNHEKGMTLYGILQIIDKYRK